MTPEQAHNILMSPSLWDALRSYRVAVSQQEAAKIEHALSQERHVLALHDRQEAADRVAMALVAALDSSPAGQS